MTRPPRLRAGPARPLRQRRALGLRTPGRGFRSSGALERYLDAPVGRSGTGIARRRARPVGAVGLDLDRRRRGALGDQVRLDPFGPAPRQRDRVLLVAGGRYT